ncbi:MAG TPA: hypothetical protein VFS37_15785 [Conexibacter sp.]|nr:hypothetical protein [Conexibacter sp.]
MSAPLSDERASGLVHARLGRPAQDLLETVVVLEAWGGVPSTAALQLDAVVAPREAAPASAAARRVLHDDEQRKGIVAEGIALLVAIVAVAAWAGPLSSQLGATTLEHALRMALPLTLALQWMLRSRYLGRDGGVRQLAEERVAVLLASAAIGAAILAIPGVGPLVALFVLTWVGGAVMARRGWGLAYAVLVTGEAIALGADAPAHLSLALLGGIVLVACFIAVATARGTVEQAPGRLPRALAAGAIGGLLGGLLVGDESLGWGVHGAFPGLALAPSVIGSLWGGYHLWQVYAAVPRGLRGMPLALASETIRGGPAMRVLIGALVRLVGITIVLSIAVLAAARWTNGADSVGVFVAFGTATLASLCVSLHESLGYVGWAFVVSLASLAVELAIVRWLAAPPPGLALSVAGAVGTLLALAPLLRQLRSPGRMLATALWIR